MNQSHMRLRQSAPARPKAACPNLMPNFGKVFCVLSWCASRLICSVSNDTPYIDSYRIRERPRPERLRIGASLRSVSPGMSRKICGRTTSLCLSARICHAHTTQSIAAIGLPKSYPVDLAGNPVLHLRCQPVGQVVWQAGLRGVRARSAQTRYGAGRELAWFPATARSVASVTSTLTFEGWFWA